MTYKKEQGCKKAQRRKDKLQHKETAAGEKYIVETTYVLTKKQEQKDNIY